MKINVLYERLITSEEINLKLAHNLMLIEEKKVSFALKRVEMLNLKFWT